MPKVNKLIKQTLGQIIHEEIELPADILVTITKVETARDLKNARIYISILPDNHGPAILKKLTKKAVALQQLLNEKVCWRFVPKLKFVWDKTEAAAAEIDELFKQIAKEKNNN